VEFLILQYFVLAFADGLCCAWLIYYIWCWCRCPEIWISSLNWVSLEDADRIQSPKCYVFKYKQHCVLDKTRRWIMSRNIIFVLMYTIVTNFYILFTLYLFVCPHFINFLCSTFSFEFNLNIPFSTSLYITFVSILYYFSP
jgi:hypothetical protein